GRHHSQGVMSPILFPRRPGQLGRTSLGRTDVLGGGTPCAQRAAFTEASAILNRASTPVRHRGRPGGVEPMVLLPDGVRARWLAALSGPGPADRPAAEAALRALYAADGRDLRHVIWFPSPTAAAWAVALLTAPHHFLWRGTVAQAERTRRLKPILEAA